MKAFLCTKYGLPDVLKLKEIEKPVPKDNEILIKVHSATVTAGDCEVRRFDIPFLFWLPLRIMFGILKPRKLVLGQEMAGEIESTGKNVTQYKKGDKIFGSTGIGMGAYAEYKCITEKHPLAKIPDKVNFEQAATIATGGINGLHFIRKANVGAGEQILINGAGGSIGTYALQIAKLFGAEVTCVDSSKKLDMLSSIGADHVIDYAQEDFTKKGKSYDVIIDVVGKSSFSGSIKSLKKKGRYVLGNPRVPGMLRGMWTSMVSSKKVLFKLAVEETEDLTYIAELIKAGKIQTVIDKRYPLEQLIEAHRYVEDGHKKGNVVITVERNNK